MMKSRILFLTAALIVSTISLLYAVPVHAATGTMNPNRIIDDVNFDNIYTMGAGQIDNFLNQFSSSCISTHRGFTTLDPTGYSPTNGFKYTGWVTAGRAIADAAQAYGLNPQVLLATLQKEQSLVNGGSGCSTLQYAAATGYGCPDGGTTHSYSNVNLYAINGKAITSVNGTCVNSSLKVGFSQQVVRAAWLLKFGEQRSEGNINWAVIKGDWDNSDDPQTCYSGPMTQGYRQVCPSGATVYYDGMTTIDSTSVHMDNGATAALYWYTPHFSGNQNFSNIYTQWFGSPTLPYAFRSASNSTIYMYVDGFKVIATAMGVLQDYGISPQSIQTLSQGTVDSIPSPGSGDSISTTLSYIVKSPSDTDADGGSVYLISVGKKYPLASMQQFSDFGFDTSNIGYLPLDFLNTIPTGGTLSNFIKSPDSSVFRVSGGQKRIIFDYSTFTKQDPSGSYTPVSYFDAGLLGSGIPETSNDILVQYSDSNAVYLLTNGSYYTVPDFNTYTCWGFSSTLNIPVFRVSNNSYISTISPASSLPECVVNDNAGNNYLLSNNVKYQIPSSYGLAGTSGISQDIVDTMTKLPTASASLRQYVRSPNSPAIWYIQGGMRRLVPTYSDFVLLGLDSTKFNIIDPTSFSSIPDSGDIKLGNGQVAKTDSSPAVYVIAGDSRILYPSSDDFLAYGNSWSNIETYPQATLDNGYPYSSVQINKYLYDQPSNNLYLVDKYGCYQLDSNLQTSYGQDQNTVKSNQSYTSSIFPALQLSQCSAGDAYVKSPNQALVYWIDGGKKYPISTWAKLQSMTGQSNPRVINLSDSTLATFPTGQSL